ncbi:MAG: tetratricopeptide repeat protein, partial [Planctomycetes bacterium]|nr:tetratricopeptide repeat protein [Planctomycetota bacterium]
ELAAGGRAAPWSEFVLALLEDRAPAPSAEPCVQAAERGRVALVAKRHDEALAAFQEAKERSPGSIVPLVLLADAADAARKRDLAVRELRAAVERLPDSAPMQARLSKLHYDLKDDVEAERAIRAAIVLAPDVGRHRFQLARALARLGKNEEALAEALRGDALAGASATTSQLQILASMLNGAERHAEARAIFERVLRIEPDQPRALYNLAFTEMSDHRFAEAVALGERMIAKGAPGRGHASLAWFFAGSNRAQCERCRAYYAEHPEHFDPHKAEEHALRALDRVEADETVPLVAQIGVTLGRRDALQKRLTELKDAAENDQRIALFERGLRTLRQ